MYNLIEIVKSHFLYVNVILYLFLWPYTYWTWESRMAQHRNRGTADFLSKIFGPTDIEKEIRALKVAAIGVFVGHTLFLILDFISPGSFVVHVFGF